MRTFRRGSCEKQADDLPVRSEFGTVRPGAVFPGRAVRRGAAADLGKQTGGDGNGGGCRGGGGRPRGRMGGVANDPSSWSSSQMLCRHRFKDFLLDSVSELPERF